MKRVIIGITLSVLTCLIINLLIIWSFTYFHMRPEKRESSFFPQSWHNSGILGGEHNAALIIFLVSILLSIITLIFYFYKTRTN